MLEIEAYMRSVAEEKKYSPRTVIAYEHDLEQFTSFCEEHEEISEWSEVTPKMVRRWVVACMSGTEGMEKISPSSVRRKLSSLSALFKYLMRCGEVNQNPVSYVPLPNKKKALPTFLTPYQLDELLDGESLKGGFPKQRDRAVLLTAYLTGMRRAELIALKLQDINFEEGEIKVHGKGDKERIVPMLPELVEELQKYIAARNLLVNSEAHNGLSKSDKRGGQPSSERGDRLNNNAQCDQTEGEAHEEGGDKAHNVLFVTDKGAPVYDKFIYRLAVRYLGEVTTNQKRSPHVLRHSFATALLNNGACIEAIRKLLGHADLSATQVYTHASIEALIKIYNQAHPRAVSSHGEAKK